MEGCPIVRLVVHVALFGRRVPNDLSLTLLPFTCIVSSPSWLQQVSALRLPIIILPYQSLSSLVSSWGFPR